MMKFLKSFLIITVIVLTLFLASIGQSGIGMYVQSTQDNNIKKTIDQLRTTENYTELENISETFLNAIVSVEDHRFYEHGGFDVVSIGRAALENMKAHEIISGGSTITQQLAKNLFLTFDQTYERKIAEVLIAKDLEAMYTKDEILELYVNVINYGEQQQGIGNASLHYFKSNPKNLNTSEAVLLAGLPQSPNNFALTLNYDRAVIRSNQVVLAMIDQNIICLNEGIKIRDAIVMIRSQR